MANLVKQRAVRIGLLALVVTVSFPQPSLTQSRPLPDKDKEYVHGSISLGYDHTYGAGPTAPRLYAGTDWEGLNKDARWILMGRLYQAFGEFDGVENPRDALIYSRLQYPDSGIFDRGVAYGVVTALPWESRGSDFKWRSAQGVGLGLRPIRSKRFTLSGHAGPGFQYIDPDEAPTEVVFSVVYGLVAYGILAPRLSYATSFWGAGASPDRDYLRNISQLDYHLTSNLSAQIAVISYFSEGIADGSKDFVGHTRVALTYHLW